MSWWNFWRRRPEDDDFGVPKQRGFQRDVQTVFMDPPAGTSDVGGMATPYSAPVAPGGSFSTGAPIGGPSFAAAPGTGTEAVPTYTGGVGDVPSAP